MDKMLHGDLFLSSSESDTYAADKEFSYKTENEINDSDDKISKKKQETKRNCWIKKKDKKIIGKKSRS